MIRIEREVPFSRSPADVFAVLTDPSRIPEWQSGVTSVVVESDGPVGVGTRWRERRIFMGRTLEQTAAVTAYEPDRSFAIEVVDGPVPLRVDHRLREEGSGTVVRVVGEGEPGGLLRFGARLVVPVVERQFEDDFARLQTIVEGGS